jgi:hypothetical protein
LYLHFQESGPEENTKYNITPIAIIINNMEIDIIIRPFNEEFNFISSSTFPFRSDENDLIVSKKYIL